MIPRRDSESTNNSKKNNLISEKWLKIKGTTITIKKTTIVAKGIVTMTEETMVATKGATTVTREQQL